MTGTVRQLRAIALLVLRGWLRQGPRVRIGKAPAPTRGVSAIMLRLLLVTIAANAGAMPGRMLDGAPRPVEVATWAALSVSFFIIGIAFATELPSPRMQTSALRSNLLEQMPISPTASLLILLSRTFGVAIPCIALGWSMHAAARPGASVVPGVGLSLVLFVVCALIGACSGHVLRRLLSPFWASRAGWLSTILSLLAFAMFEISLVPKLTFAAPLGHALGRAFMAEGTGRVLLVLVVLALLLVMLFARLQRSAELAEPIRPGTMASRLAGGANMLALERLLNRREPGRFQIPMAVVFCAGVQIWLLSWVEARVPAGFLRTLFVIVNLQMVSIVGAQRATRAVTRDMLARPLLGALPITPRDTLAAKVTIVRRALLAVAVTLVIYPAFLYWRGEPLGALAWQAPLYLIGAATYAAATVYVAFLTAGLGAAQPRGGALGSFESLVVAIPFASIAFAPSPWSALLSLATLVALTFEARRAALKSIDWLDDPEGEPGTEVWKALVAFGVFQGAQALAAQIAALFSSLASDSARLFAAYGVSAAALGILTAREQEQDLPERRLRLAWLGLATGALSGGSAWLYLKLAPHLETPRAMQASGLAEVALLVIAVVVLAPIVEERFFRGWLQPALGRALGRRAAWAPVIAAVAFAAVHPVYSFVPVLVLGLINGYLMQRTRSLSACIVSHAVHNALALWLAVRG
jgi:membrane protease YdiL (CAAX protease family)